MVVSGRKWISEDRTAVACCGGQWSNMDISRQNSSYMLWWSAVESGFQKTEQQWHVVVVSGQNLDISRQNSSDMLWWSAVESGFQKTEQQWHIVVVSGQTWISVDRTAVTCCGGQR